MSELTRRYVVLALATAAPFDPADREGVFVLKPWKDPAALRALAAYRDNCYPELARDLDAWIREIQAGPSVRGDVGRRNDSHVHTGHDPKRKPKSGAARRPTGIRPICWPRASRACASTPTSSTSTRATS